MHTADRSTDGPRVSDPLSAGDDVVLTVVRALAALEDKTPTALSPLAGSVDPEALEELVRTADCDLEVAFTHAGHRVVVTPQAVAVYYSSH